MEERGGSTGDHTERFAPPRRGGVARVVHVGRSRVGRGRPDAGRDGARARGPAGAAGRGRPGVGRRAPASDPVPGVGRERRSPHARPPAGAAGGGGARSRASARGRGGRPGPAERARPTGVHDVRSGSVGRVPAGGGLLRRPDGPHRDARQRAARGRVARRRVRGGGGAHGGAASRHSRRPRNAAGRCSRRSSRARPTCWERSPRNRPRSRSSPDSDGTPSATSGRSNAGSRGGRARCRSATGQSGSCGTSTHRRVATTWWS